MISAILIALISLVSLMVLHEFGHFILAKKFGVKVEEFGIGYPPRLFGKKIGETLYSINLLPFGAFVKIPGEIERLEDPGSFSQKPIWQRALIVLGGVLSFWIVSAVILSITMGIGAPTSISDDEAGNLENIRVQVAGVSANSPAEIAGIKVGDTIREFSISNSEFPITKVKEVQELTSQYKGEEITLTIERGKEVINVSLTIRASPPAGEGAMGVALARTAIKTYSPFEAVWQGIKSTFNLTLSIIQGYYQVIVNLVKGVPSGAQLMGPVGIVDLFRQASQVGISFFLQFIAIISIYVALFNILPIPSVDGGKFLFLMIEAIRKKPVSQKTEQKITTVCFGLLLILMVFVTIKDVVRIF